MALIFGLDRSAALAQIARAMAPLLHLKDISVAFGGTRLLDGAELSVAAGERLCLVGRNGSGKSTLLKIAAGLIEADARHALRPARRHHPLSAAGTRSQRLLPPPATMSKPGCSRMKIPTAPFIFWAIWG